MILLSSVFLSAKKACIGFFSRAPIKREILTSSQGQKNDEEPDFQF